MDIQVGEHVVVRTARGERVEMIARSRETNGRDVRVVWVSGVEEYAAEGDAAHQTPWPVEAVELLTSV